MSFNIQRSFARCQRNMDLAEEVFLGGITMMSKKLACPSFTEDAKEMPTTLIPWMNAVAIVHVSDANHVGCKH